MVSQKKIRVGINGFGRIGRHLFRLGYQKWDIVAINDLPYPTETFAHLLKYDSLFGEFSEDVRTSGSTLQVGKSEIPFLRESDVVKIPWDDYGVDVVIEASGQYTSREDLKHHFKPNVKKVIATCPTVGEDFTFVSGINDHEYDFTRHHLISSGSCTSNCLIPILDMLDQRWGIEHAFMTTTHCYTQNQRLIDAPHTDLRRARMAGTNMIPTPTQAIDVTLKVLPHLKGRLSGLAVRVPISNVSLIELVCDLKHEVSKEEVNKLFEDRSSRSNILRYTEIPLVSSDFMKSSESAIIAGDLTQVVNGKLLHVLAWYNNEWGYANRVSEIVDVSLGL